MEQSEGSIDIDRPADDLYFEWTRFERYPQFMSGVREVRATDATHVHWRAEMWDREREWDAAITSREPGKSLAWKSTSGPPNAGTVRLERLALTRTRSYLAMSFEPQRAAEKDRAVETDVKARVEGILSGFKRYIDTAQIIDQT
jgi:uncharacterized membrane protein